MIDNVQAIKNYIEEGEFYSSMEAMTVEEALRIASSIEENTPLTYEEVLALLTLQD